MPVVVNLRSYKRPNGQRVRIRLYGAYRNMLARIRGQVRTGRGGAPIWYGLETDFKDFEDFRAWALANGYSRIRCSLDREKSHRGYIRSNLRWVTPLQNSTFANLCGLKTQRRLRKEAARFAGQQECAI